MSEASSNTSTVKWDFDQRFEGTPQPSKVVVKANPIWSAKNGSFNCLSAKPRGGYWLGIVFHNGSLGKISKQRRRKWMEIVSDFCRIGCSFCSSFFRPTGEDRWSIQKHLEVCREIFQRLSIVLLCLPKKGLQAHQCLDFVSPSTFPWWNRMK